MSKFNQGNKRACKLNGVQVMEIREKYATGLYTYARLAREYQVTVNTISSIVNGLSWQELPPVIPSHVIEEGALRSMRKLEAMLAGDGLPPPTAVIEDDETIAAMQRAVERIPQPGFDKPSAAIEARMAAYGARRPEVGTQPVAQALSDELTATDSEPAEPATSSGRNYEEATGVQPPMRGNPPATEPALSTDEELQDVDKTGGEEG